jgi:hypothetical protein
MTRDEAEAEATRLATEHPDRETHRWVPREEADGTWSVMKIGLPPIDTATTAETRADERPPTGEDPRSPAHRNLGPNVGPGF